MLGRIIKNLGDEQFGLKKYMLYIYIYVYRIKTATLRDTILALKKWEKNQTFNAFWRRLLVTTMNSDFRQKRSTLSPKFASVYLVAISSNLLLPLFSTLIIFFLTLFFNLSFRLIIGEHPGKIRHLREISFICMYDIHIYTPIVLCRAACVYIYTINVN